MKTLHYYIIAVLIVSIAIVIMIEFPIPYSGTVMIVPSGPHVLGTTIRNTIDEQKARSLAESYVDELKTMSYGCQFQSLSGIYGTDSDGASKLDAVQVGYTCTSKYVGAFVIVEDPQMTKVLNVTTFPSSRFGF